MNLKSLLGGGGQEERIKPLDWKKEQKKILLINLAILGAMLVLIPIVLIGGSAMNK